MRTKIVRQVIGIAPYHGIFENNNEWGSGLAIFINILIILETMKRIGFSPYGPSKAALESMSIIWAQGLAVAGIPLNILLPVEATLTGKFKKLT